MAKTKQRKEKEWPNGAGEDTAQDYRIRRSFHPGYSSTLRKTAKAHRIAGKAPEPPVKEKARHMHPRRLRKQG